MGLLGNKQRAFVIFKAGLVIIMLVPFFSVLYVFDSYTTIQVGEIHFKDTPVPMSKLLK